MDISIFDPQYVAKQQVASLQKMAAEQNALKLQAFNQACADYISSYGKAPLPVVPEKIVVDDAGNWNKVPFDGLVVPTLPAPAPSTGSLRPTATPVDRTDQIIAILQVLNAKLDALAPKA